ncbi:hypothetical protein ACEWY4_009352 [Coilia grayii]|uniref:Sprouty n=1 Tax=Coilia grayii TaxID=363190 RepID=A0ABD1K6B0_9TELE
MGKGIVMKNSQQCVIGVPTAVHFERIVVRVFFLTWFYLGSVSLEYTLRRCIQQTRKCLACLNCTDRQAPRNSPLAVRREGQGREGKGAAASPMESRVPQHIPGVSSSIMAQPLLDSRVPYGRLQHPLTIYPIDQMKSSHVENDYIDSPAAVCQQPQQAQQPKHLASGGRQPDAHHNHNHNHHHHHHHHHHHPHSHTQDSTHPWISFSGRPSSISSSSSTSSDQRLLDHAAPTPVLDTASNTTSSTTTTTSSSSISSSSLPPAAPSLGQAPSSGGGGGITGGFQAKLLGTKPTDLKTGMGSRLDGPVGSVLPAEAKHLLLCDRCKKCRCTECTLPRALPSCWVCHQACLCSAQSLVDAATCMCLVKGVFYHCAEDEDDGDEGSCADRPCSCAPAHRCARWSFMAVMSLALPCLLCYLPAVGCAKLSQKCYDGARRPGCRCKAPAASKAGVAGILGKPGGGLDKQAS